MYIYIYQYRHVALHRLNYISTILLHVLIAPYTCLFRPERLAVLSFQLIRVVCSVWEEGRHIARVCLFFPSHSPLDRKESIVAIMNSSANHPCTDPDATATNGMNNASVGSQPCYSQSTASVGSQPCYNRCTRRYIHSTHSHCQTPPMDRPLPLQPRCSLGNSLPLQAV